jgi:hypothetical protein
LEGLVVKDVGLFYGNLVYLAAIWYMFWLFGICFGYLEYVFFPVLVYCTKKNLATLIWASAFSHGNDTRVDLRRKMNTAVKIRLQYKR